MQCAGAVMQTRRPHGVFHYPPCASLVLGAKLGVLPACPQLGQSGSHGGPCTILWQQCGFFLFSVFFLTSPRTAAFTRARQTDPLRAIKPSKREQRGQVLGGCIESSPAASGGTNRARSARPRSPPPLQNASLGTPQPHPQPSKQYSPLPILQRSG